MATYGQMIDHLWAYIGNNTARRVGWTAGKMLVVGQWDDAEVEQCAPLIPSHGVFNLDDGFEYESPAEDMMATDWVLS